MTGLLIAWMSLLVWMFLMRVQLGEWIDDIYFWIEQHIQTDEPWPALPGTPQLARTFIVCTILSGVIVFCLFPLPAAILLLSGGIGSVWFMLRRRHVQLRQQLESQLVEVLSSLASAIQSGMSVVQALQHLSRRQPQPLGPELMAVTRAMDLGCSWDEALLALQERIRMPTLDVIIAALTYGKSGGADLPRVLTDLGASLGALQRESRRLETSTAQARLQLRVMTAVVPGMAVLLYSLDADLMAPLWSTSRGWLLLCIILVLQVLSWMVTRQILRGVS